MTWGRRLALLKLWLHLNGTLVGLGLGGLLVVALGLAFYLPIQKQTSHEGVVDGFGFIDSEAMGRLPTLWVKLDGGMSVSVPVRRGVVCRKGDRITVLRRGGLRGYTSDVTGCRRPALPERDAPG